jgi:hypothetical protein
MSELSNLPSQKDAIAAAIALYPTRPFAVSDIGSQTGWLKAASHDARNLYVSGPMGLATSVALGLAAVRPNEQVLAIAGDGALAMNLTSLATIAGRSRRTSPSCWSTTASTNSRPACRRRRVISIGWPWAAPSSAPNSACVCQT